MRFLITGDWHIREDQPTSRTDDFWETQKRKLEWLFEFAVMKGCSHILQPGDFFNRGRPVQSQILEVFMIQLLQKHRVSVLAVPGNHDLPYHRMDQLDRSSIGVLIEGGFVWNLDANPLSVQDIEVFGAGWGNELPKTDPEKLSIGVAHVSIDVDNSFPGWENARDYLRRQPYQLLVTGDNHQQFEIEEDEKLLINPGCLTRQSISDIDHEPAVYLFDTDRPGSFTRVPVPIEHGVLVQSKRKEIEERDEKIQAFVESMKRDGEVSLSFESNLKRMIDENNVPQPVADLIWESIGV